MNMTDKKCRNCFFGYLIDGGELAECHAPCPTRRKDPFTIVRGCDYCSFWTDEKTMEHPFLIPFNGLTYHKITMIGTEKKRGE